MPVDPITVVCVDDDLDVLDLIVASAEETDDFDVVAVTSDAGTLLELLRVHRPHVVVLDHGLDDEGPVIDLRERGRGHRPQLGLELVEVVREAVPEATVVVFTGWPGLDVAAANVGVDVFVEKPDISAIWREVRRVRTTAPQDH